ncbi:hypothetical protein [Vibrio sp. F74]|uniref:hypothetical protein n=1 Tax=Vibrio sp. F74 TaxID=700020 RepID=UPI0035F58846
MTIFVSEIDKKLIRIAKEMLTVYSRQLVVIHGGIIGLALVAGTIYIGALFASESYGIAFFLKGILTIALFCVAIGVASNWLALLGKPNEQKKTSIIITGFAVFKALPKKIIAALITVIIVIAFALDTFYVVQLQTITTTMPTNPAMHIIVSFAVILGITIFAGLTEPELAAKVRSLHNNKYYLIFIAKASIVTTTFYYLSCLVLDFGSLNIAIAFGSFWSALLLAHIDGYSPTSEDKVDHSVS